MGVLPDREDDKEELSKHRRRRPPDSIPKKFEEEDWTCSSILQFPYLLSENSRIKQLTQGNVNDLFDFYGVGFKFWNHFKSGYERGYVRIAAHGYKTVKGSDMAR